MADIKSDILSYVPGSQYIIEALGQSTGEPSNEYAKYTDLLNQPVEDLVGVVTSWGSKYKLAFEDLKKGNFAKATLLLENIGSNPAYNMVPVGIKNKSTELFHYPKPTEEDYIQGSFRRYFLQDVRSGEIKEINSETYKNIINKGYYRRTKLEWNLLGPSEDETVNGYIYPGAVARNRDVVLQAEEAIPGMTEFLSDLKQFVVEEASKPNYASDEIEKLNAFVLNGGKLEDYYARSQPGGLDVDSLDATKESDAKLAIRERARLQGYSEDRIKRAIARYEDSGTLEDEGEQSVEFLKEYKENTGLAYLDKEYYTKFLIALYELNS